MIRSKGAFLFILELEGEWNLRKTPEDPNSGNEAYLTSRV